MLKFSPRAPRKPQRGGANWGAAWPGTVAPRYVRQSCLRQLAVTYGRAIVITGVVQVSVWAGFLGSPSAFNTEMRSL